jgi:hypothetical protein
MVDTEVLVGDLIKRLPVIRELQDAVWGGPQPAHTALPVDDLVRCACELKGCTIEVLQVPFVARHLVSLVERQSEDKFLIAVRQDAPFVERRYGVVKEICHIVGDAPEDYQPHGEKTLAWLFKQGTANLYDKTLDLGGEGRGVPSEKRAERMADELLYDWRLRLDDTKAQKLSASNVDIEGAYGISTAVAVRVLRSLAIELMGGLWHRTGL